ncbi:hypothetical protein VIBNISFn118_630019 [Vibrio nigripulchritudo SFn118]|nr:hypothetical protein VIBNISFn118_630019 [Vibrio nigripulchritudo SFn118]
MTNDSVFTISTEYKQREIQAVNLGKNSPNVDHCSITFLTHSFFGDSYKKDHDSGIFTLRLLTFSIDINSYGTSYFEISLENSKNIIIVFVYIKFLGIRLNASCGSKNHKRISVKIYILTTI